MCQKVIKSYKLILYTKQCIFSCLKKGNFLELLFFLFNKYKVEKYTSITHQNLVIVKFNNTWHLWKGIFDNMQNTQFLYFNQILLSPTLMNNTFSLLLK
jgi:hypothetical protein